MHSPPPLDSNGRTALPPAREEVVSAARSIAIPMAAASQDPNPDVARYSRAWEGLFRRSSAVEKRTRPSARPCNNRRGRCWPTSPCEGKTPGPGAMFDKSKE